MSTPNSAPKYCGKRLTPRSAIRSFCRWCNGGNPESCASPQCPLFALRQGKLSKEPSLTPLRAIRARCLECAGSAEAVRACVAFKPFSEVQPECPLWPHRDGKRHVSAGYRAERREQAKKQLGASGPGAPFRAKEGMKQHGRGVDSPAPSLSGPGAEFDALAGGAA